MRKIIWSGSLSDYQRTFGELSVPNGIKEYMGKLGAKLIEGPIMKHEGGWYYLFDFPEEGLGSVSIDAGAIMTSIEVLASDEQGLQRTRERVSGLERLPEWAKKRNQ